ncbi:FkbM family methyltransferase [Desulfovibrio sp. OttesenSCG-928-I05]|nr:FkbM family methyltransferase [Desulfovibrio sp. OttesenSCG-928-I05]
MNKTLAHAICLFIPIRSVRKNVRRKLLNKDIQSTVAISNGMKFNVLPIYPGTGDFWKIFNDQSWELETFNFYKKYVRPDKNVIDIGGWIGPTMIIAYSFNPRRICVVEADPANYQILKHNCYGNYMQDKVELFNICISDRTGDIVGFGSIDKGKEDSTTHCMNGDRIRVVTTDIIDFLKARDLENTNIIKIDIEGAESVIADGLDYIARFTGIRILLSMHPPFWDKPKAEVAARLLPIIQKYDIFTDDDRPMDLKDVEKMMLDESPCGWDGKTGMFFSIILKTKDANMLV